MNFQSLEASTPSANKHCRRLGFDASLAIGNDMSKWQGPVLRMKIVHSYVDRNPNLSLLDRMYLTSWAEEPLTRSLIRCNWTYHCDAGCQLTVGSLRELNSPRVQLSRKT